MFCKSFLLLIVSRALGICPLGSAGRTSPPLMVYSLLLLAFLFYVCLDETLEEFITTDPPGFPISPTRLSLTSRVVMAAENMCVLFTLVGCVLGNAHGSSQFRRMTFRLQALERIIHFTHREYALQVSAALCMIVEIGVNVLEYFCWSFVFGADSFLEYSAVYVSQLVCGVVLLQFVDFVLRLNNRFTHLNQLLRKNVTYWKVGFRKEDQLMKPFYLVVERGGQSVIRLVEVHTRLCQLIDTLCRVYGVQMFFIASYTVLNLTFCTYYTVICSFHPRYDKVRVAILIPEAALTLLYAPKLILLLWSCTAAERQASLTKAILGECIEPENSDSPYQKQIVLSLIKLQYNNTSFTCLGIIHFRLPLIINIAAVVTTYLAIIIQLQVPTSTTSHAI